jgi:hypothetical protein
MSGPDPGPKASQGRIFYAAASTILRVYTYFLEDDVTSKASIPSTGSCSSLSFTVCSHGALSYKHLGL